MIFIFYFQIILLYQITILYYQYITIFHYCIKLPHQITVLYCYIKLLYYFAILCGVITGPLTRTTALSRRSSSTSVEASSVHGLSSGLRQSAMRLEQNSNITPGNRTDQKHMSSKGAHSMWPAYADCICRRRQKRAQTLS